MVVLIYVGAVLASSDEDKSAASKIKIHLPREITVDRNDITIGDVSILFGDIEQVTMAKKNITWSDYII